ncbi:hypothetical protein [Nocardia sp. NPDC051570]|uniref:hypothetical protein n=1 Tax=Nocardia sp. NPDC051570 TaxID=3364324 RepID=UPI00378BB152
MGRANDAESWTEERSKAIWYGAQLIAAALVVLGLLCWQPWAEPEYRRVKMDGGPTVMCVTYKNSVTCPP